MLKQSKSWISNTELELASHVAELNLEHTNLSQKSPQLKNTAYTKYGKRVFDVVAATLALIFSLPINLILAVVTLLDVGRPILYKQERTGKDLKTFTLVKFRNMTNEKDINGELLPPSQRVTKVGRILRKYSIDELLNFWSLIKGDMSLIGPRPLPEEYNLRMSERHMTRYLVRPGLECPLTKESMMKYPFPEPYSRYHTQFENDIWYVENISFATDIKLLFRLIRMVFDMQHRKKGAQAASPFIGYDEKGNAVSVAYWNKHNLEREPVDNE